MWHLLDNLCNTLHVRRTANACDCRKSTLFTKNLNERLAVKPDPFRSDHFRSVRNALFQIRNTQRQIG